MVEDTSKMDNCIDLEIINQAITIIAGAQFCISDDEFLLVFSGFSIWQTLNLLTTMKGLPLNYHAEIVKKAQES